MAQLIRNSVLVSTNKKCTEKSVNLCIALFFCALIVQLSSSETVHADLPLTPCITYLGDAVINWQHFQYYLTTAFVSAFRLSRLILQYITLMTKQESKMCVLHDVLVGHTGVQSYFINEFDSKAVSLLHNDTKGVLTDDSIHFKTLASNSKLQENNNRNVRKLKVFHQCSNSS